MLSIHFRRLFKLCLLVGVVTAVLALSLSGRPQAQESHPPRTNLESLPRYPLAEAPEAQFALEAVTVVPASKVAFQSYRNENWDIFIGNDDGTGQTAVTNNENSEIHPHLNRGNSAIVYASRVDENDYEIYRMNADGNNKVALTNNGADDGNPQWSPDGTKIAFESYRDGQAEIYVMNADGSGQTRLTNSGDFDGMPTWSPDGTKIAFSSRRTGVYRIWAMNADGSNPVQLSAQPYSLRPQWSPDGSRIAYDADGDNNGWQELWLMNADGSDQQNEMYNYDYNTNHWMGSWSPDGRYIAITSIHFVYYQGNWYWDYAYQKGRDINLYQHDSTTFPLSQSNVDWYPRWQTNDAQQPVSQVQALPTVSPGTFTVNWFGLDAGGSGGIHHYDVQVKTGSSGNWTNWQMGTTATSAQYSGTGGTSYYFRARATDRHYNTESWPGSHDAVTTIEALPPQSYIHTLPTYSRHDDTPLITWGGYDPGGSGIASYDVQYRINNGSWNNWLTNTPAAGANFDNSNGSSGDAVYFRIRATDRAQNEANWPAPGGEVNTTLYAWGIQGTAYDNTDTPVSGILVGMNPAAIGIVADDNNGHYVAYSGTDAEIYEANWNKNGYNPLPDTIFSAGIDANKDVWLPPTNNIVSNSDFEDGLVQNDWQLSGTVTPLITDFIKHTGEYGLMLGQRSLDFLPVEIVDSGYNPKIAVDSEGTVHIVWGNTNLYYVYRLANGNWSQIQQIASNPYPLEELLVDRNGNLHGVGGTSNQGLYYVHRNKSDGQWSLTTVVNDGNWSRHPDLAVDSLGTAHIVWDSRYPGTPNTTIKYSSRLGDGTFTTPLGFQNTFGYPEEPQIAIDRANKIHIVWLSAVDYDSMKIMYVSNAHRSWPQAQYVTGIVEDASYFDFSVEEEGSVHIVWRNHLTNVPTIYYRYLSSDGRWSDIQSVIQTSWGRGIQTAVDTRGTFHMIWNADNSIYHIQKGKNASWQLADLLANTETEAEILLDGYGNAHIVWGGGPYSDSPNDDIHHMQQIEGGTWSTPVNLSPGENDPNSPEAVIDASGAVHIVWEILTNSEPYQTEVHYRGPEFSSSNENSIITQQITIPVTMTAPTFSFVYRLGGISSSNDTAFSVMVDDDSTQTEVVAFQESSLDWSHGWVDLTQWTGQTISVSFTLQQMAGEPFAWAYLDEVSIGSTYPDGWVTVGDGNALPGQQVVQTLTYGNRGGAVANGVTLTYTLPAEMTFISASVPPASTNPLVWHLADLPAKSEEFVIEVTARVNPSAPPFTNLTSTAVIHTTDTELEMLNNEAEGRTYTAALVYLPVMFR